MGRKAVLGFLSVESQAGSTHVVHVFASVVLWVRVLLMVLT